MTRMCAHVMKGSVFLALPPCGNLSFLMVEHFYVNQVRPTELNETQEACNV